MNANEVIESYVIEVMRRVPAKDRNGIGLELRGLLGEMLADRTAASGAPLDDAAVLAMLREFGTPAEVAARYQPPGMTIIPPDETKTFTWTALGGVALQWAGTLPHALQTGAFPAWWLTWGLGALWWPGFVVMMYLIAASMRRFGLYKPTWRPRTLDPDRVNRGALDIGLAGYAIGAIFMVALPWLTPSLPGVLPQVLAVDADFLRLKAWPVLVLWAAGFAVLVMVRRRGRWSPLLRRAEIAISVGFIVLLTWWIVDGPMFVAKATNDGARGALALVVAIIVIGLGVGLYRERTQIRPLGTFS